MCAIGKIYPDYLAIILAMAPITNVTAMIIIVFIVQIYLSYFLLFYKAKDNFYTVLLRSVMLVLKHEKCF